MSVCKYVWNSLSLTVHCFRSSENCNYTKTRVRIEFWLKSYKSTRQFQEDLPLGTSYIPSIFKDKERNPQCVMCWHLEQAWSQKVATSITRFLRSGFDIFKCIDLLGLLFSSWMVTAFMSTMNKQCLLQRQTTSTCCACHPSTHTSCAPLCKSFFKPLKYAFIQICDKWRGFPGSGITKLTFGKNCRSMGKRGNC